MNETHILITLATVHFVALMSPGPDVALVVQNSSRYGRQTGLYIALGLSCGIFFHSLLSITGVSYLIHQQPVLFGALQVFGGGYLLYLGYNALSETIGHWKEQFGLTSNQASIVLANPRQAFSRGFMTNLLNPKALVFFVSLMSTLIPSEMSVTGKSIALMILWSLSLLWFGSLNWVLSTKRMQRKLQSASRYIDLLCGVVFTVIGGFIIWQSIQRFLFGML